MGVLKLYKEKYCQVLIVTLVILSFYSFFYVYAEGESQPELPSIIISSFKVDVDFLRMFPEYQRTTIEMTLKICHPYTEEISLEHIEYKIYANETLIEERSTKFKEILMKDKEIIPPGEVKTIEIIPDIDFSKIDESTKNLILERKAKWNVTGTVYINTSKGVLTAPIQSIRTDYPSKTFNTIIYVKDKDWNPIVQVKVTLFSEFYILNEFTDEEGKAIFLNLPYTNYTLALKVSKEGYFPYEKSIDVSEPKPPTGEIVELYLITRLPINVRDAAGTPIIDANITFASEVGNFTRTTNASGIAEFEIPRANYTLTVFKKGYLPHKESWDLSKFKIESKVIRLTAEIPWWKEYGYLIARALAVSIAIPVIVILIKRKRTTIL